MPSYETVEELKHIPIRDNGEPLVDFVKFGIHFSPRHPVFPFPRVHLLRQGVVQRLCEAQRRLPSGIYMVIVEGYRPLEVQKMQFQANFRRFQSLFPKMPPDELRLLVEDFSAPPDHEHVPPPHTTGGAFDVFLENETGEQMDMSSPYAMDDHEGAAFDAPHLSDEARRNRDILCDALQPTGITNYRGEWWHWSYGDQGWAHRGGFEAAVYDCLGISVEEAEQIQGEPADRSEPLRPWPVAVP
jgi:zinc D-Ala-D-Ala dipeptidase